MATTTQNAFAVFSRCTKNKQVHKRMIELHPNCLPDKETGVTQFHQAERFSPIIPHKLRSCWTSASLSFQALAFSTNSFMKSRIYTYKQNIYHSFLHIYWLIHYDTFKWINTLNFTNFAKPIKRRPSNKRIEIKLFVPGFHTLAVSGTRSGKLLRLFLPQQAARGSSRSSPEKHGKHLSCFIHNQYDTTNPANPP